MRLEAKSVVITGAAGGLGRALAAAFAHEGARLVLADVDAEALEQAAAEVDAVTVTTDVSDPQQVDALVDRAVDAYGRLDVMVNNAGVLSPNARLHNLTVEDWRRSLDVNVIGTFNGIRAAVRAMRPQGGGAIVNTGSVAAITAWAYTGPYGATKAAVVHLTRIAAVEYAKERIRVNCVCPGSFPSPIHAGVPSEALDAIGARHPLGLGRAEDVVGAFVYLASDEAGWTTGAALVVDGGYSAL
jgi:NAD(P)-dependent dehydrogenase (short-subunit alcohol dehydrogenase family)